MGHIILVLGGAKSGKTSYALRLGEEIHALKRYYIATAVVCDDEMKKKVELHIRERGERWITIEAPYDIEGGISSLGEREPLVLVDCLTMWLNNLMFEGLTDGQIYSRIDSLLSFLSGVSGTIILVSNEVGLGIVPQGEEARRFRELAGRLNQEMARIAREVFFVIAGLAIKIKG